ncbi:MAG: alpha/beta hydrolase, partial [Microthrixaceae bacterium]
MPVDAELQPILDLVNSVAAPAPSADRVEELRESFALLAAAFGPGRDDVEIEGVGVSSCAAPLGLRIYRSTAADAPRRPGALVWFHGGGWVIGDLDTHDALCRELCVRSGVTVISVDYRLAPEHRFPAAHDDATCALEWIAEHAVELEIDPARLAVGGDSAGGHLATVAALRARSGGPDLRAQVLVYPVTDLAGTAERYPSRRDNAEGYLLTTETRDFFSD